MQNYLDTKPHNYVNMIMGDFNFNKKYIQWSDGEEEGIIGHLVESDKQDEDAKCAPLILEFSLKNNFTQQIIEPTRENETLDLCFTSGNDVIQNQFVNDILYAIHFIVK